jgi:hypothetical protein
VMRGDPMLGTCLNTSDGTYIVLRSPIPASNV